ncbi:MAG: lipopolysaccharide biosynthesis protein [Acutalibacteraceae bacterium]|jgi:O-antigen/teichoic acid export membrane protein
MRTKQAFKNAAFSVLLQLSLAISGILVPRFFIALYGSAVNGLVSSISQFITYMSLVEAGVGAAATVSLYKPLADSDVKAVNGVLSATKRFYIRSGLLFAGLVALLVTAYPYLVHNEINDTSFIRLMILVLSVNGLVDYFILGKYRVLLMADQRGYILYAIQIVGTVVMTAVSILQIKLECSALLVKSTAAAIYILRSLAAIIYCRKKYPHYSYNQEPNTAAFSQRNAALLHQIVGVIANNAAVILLTLMLKRNALAEVSVYSVYNMVAYSLWSFLHAIINGLTPSFGQVVSKDERQVLRDSFGSYEFLMFIITFFCYTCMTVLLYPFIHLYSAQFTDGVVYLRWELVALFSAAGILQSARLPGLTLICAAGHYKETQLRAIIELIINLAVSVALTPFLGVAGVMIGICCSYLYRSIDIILFTAKRYLPGSLKTTLSRLLRNGITAAALIFLGFKLVPLDTSSWIMWLVSAVLYSAATGIIIFTVNLLFEKREIVKLLNRAKEMLKNR